MNYLYILTIIFISISCSSNNESEIESTKENQSETVTKAQIKTITNNYLKWIRIEYYDTLGNKISEYYIVNSDTLESKQFIWENGRLKSEYRIEMNDTNLFLQYEYSEDNRIKKVYSISGDTIQSFGTYYIDEDGNEYANSWNHKVRGLEDTNSYWYDSKGNMIKSYYHLGGETT